MKSGRGKVFLHHGGGWEVGEGLQAFFPFPTLCLIWVSRCFIMQKPLAREFSIVPFQATPGRELGADPQALIPEPLL